MYVIVKRSLAFNPPQHLKDKGVRTLVLRAAPAPQQVPEWIHDTNEFKLSTADDSITEVITTKQQHKVAAAAPTPTNSAPASVGSHTSGDSPSPESQARKVIPTAGLGITGEAHADGTETVPENGNALGIGSMVGVVDKEASAAIAADTSRQHNQNKPQQTQQNKPNQQRQGGGR